MRKKCKRKNRKKWNCLCVYGVYASAYTFASKETSSFSRRNERRLLMRFPSFLANIPRHIDCFVSFHSSEMSSTFHSSLKWFQLFLSLFSFSSSYMRRRRKKWQSKTREKEFARVNFKIINWKFKTRRRKIIIVKFKSRFSFRSKATKVKLENGRRHCWCRESNALALLSSSKTTK